MTDRTEADPLGDDPAHDDRDGSVAVVDAPSVHDDELVVEPSDRPADEEWVGVPPAGEPGLLRRIGRRIVRRPTEWARRPWPAARIVKVTVTGLSLFVTT